MKISRKFFLLNISIILITMIVLSFVLTDVIQDFVYDNVSDDLYAENKMLLNSFSYKEALNISDNEIQIDKKLSSLKVGNKIWDVIVVENDGKLYYETLKDNGKINLSDDVINDLMSLPYEEINEIDIDEHSYIAVKLDPISNDEEMIITVISLISDYDVVEVINSIKWVLIKTIILICLLSFLALVFYEKQLTKPINILMDATKRIGEKNFNESIEIKTGDEFEELGNAFNQMSGRLNELDIKQKQFYENISHEIKTPLAVVSGYAQCIKTGIIEKEDEALDTIVDECTRLKTMLENFILLSKLDTVEEIYNFEKININDVIGNTLNSLESLIVVNEIDVLFEPEEEMYLFADEHKLGKLFSNVLLNCIKFASGKIEINVMKLDKYFVISITDDGPGFSDTILNKPIARNIISENDGNGLGLSIIDKIAKGHDGLVSLSNNECGAVYQVKLLIKE